MKHKVLKLFNDIYLQTKDNLLLRVLCAIYLFDFFDKLKLKAYPEYWFNLLEEDLSDFLNCQKFFNKYFDCKINAFDKLKQGEIEKSIQEETGEVYYNLWKDFDKKEYYRNTYNILKQRFTKNDIHIKDIQHALDKGCGSGRYSVALNKLGCLNVTGIDVSLNSIKFAKKMCKLTDHKNINYYVSSVLNVPFDSDCFDFVFSNGVLHHTTSTNKGIEEIHRILKNKGQCWLYLYGGKESFFWDMVDMCRKLIAPIPQHYTQQVMKLLGYHSGRIFHRTDFFYVPINNRYFEKEVIQMIQDSGFSNYRRLKRGTEYDWDEIINNNPKIDPYLFGEGEMRFLLTK